MDVTRFRDEAAGFCLSQAVLVEVASNTASQVLCFTDVKHRACTVGVKINSRFSRKLRNFVSQIDWHSYTFIVTRKCALACLLGLFCAVLLPAQATSAQDKQNGSQSEPATDKTASPPSFSDTPDVNPDDLPEEDDSLRPKTFPFNPLEAERNIKVGEFYMRQGTARGYRAAVGRFEDATRYNPGSAEAFLKLGEAEQKLKHSDKAKSAFEKAVKLAPPDSKVARDARKKIAART